MPHIGFKEWSLVCEALGQGQQTLILRKGGIHEGRKGFQFQHDAYWLFPTGFHTQADLLTWTPQSISDFLIPKEETREKVEIRYWTRTEQLWKVTEWQRLLELRPHHIWKDSVLEERFLWNEDSCLHVALVRVYRRTTPWCFDYEKKFGGCRSWVNLPTPDDVPMEAVLTDKEWNQQAAQIRRVLIPSS